MDLRKHISTRRSYGTHAISVTLLPRLQKSIAELHEKERQRLFLESEKSALSDKLETRKVVDRAKGILQRDLKINEADAYCTLQREPAKAEVHAGDRRINHLE